MQKQVKKENKKVKKGKRIIEVEQRNQGAENSIRLDNIITP